MQRQPLSVKGRGIVLLTTLAIVAFMVMLCTMLLVSANATLHNASTYLDQEMAMQAAMSGLAFAEGEIANAPDWMTPTGGTASNPTNFITGPSQSSLNLSKTAGNVTVSETTTGQVVGTITATNGAVSQFYISFNPTINNPMPYCSLNNFSNSSASSMDYNGTPWRAVQQNALGMVVRGVVINSSGVARATRYVEAQFLQNTSSLVPAVAFAGGMTTVEVDAGSGRWTVNSQHTAGNSQQPGLDSMNSMYLYATAGGGATNTQQAFPDQGNNSFNLTFPDLASNSPTGQLIDYSSGSTYQLPDQQLQAQSSMASQYPRMNMSQAFTPPSSYNINIPAGAYVYWNQAGTTTPNSTPYYYPGLSLDQQNPLVAFSFDNTNYTITQTWYTDSTHTTVDPTRPAVTWSPQANSSGTPTLPNGTSALFTTQGFGNNTSAAVNFNGAAQVTPDSTGNNDLSILAAPGYGASLSINVNPASGQGNWGGFFGGHGHGNGNGSSSNGQNIGVLYDANGSLNLLGMTQGTGSVVSGANISFSGNSSLQPPQGAGLSMFAQGNIQLAPITNFTVPSGSTQLSAAQAVISDAAAALSSGQDQSGTTYTLGSSTTNISNRDYNALPQGLASTASSYTVGGTATAPMQTIVNYLGTNQQSKVQAFIQSILQQNSANAGGGQVKLTTDQNAVAQPSAQDQTFFGLIYAQGNFTADLTGGSVSSTSPNLTLQGGLVAYGGNPDGFTQGSPSTYPGSGANPGNIFVRARNVTFTYDPSYMGALNNSVFSTTTTTLSMQYFSSF
jgi:hypothetical protein